MANTSSNSTSGISLQTIEDFEPRLLQAEHYLLGHSGNTSKNDENKPENENQNDNDNDNENDRIPSVRVRIARVEGALRLLASNFKAVWEVLNLYQKHPELYPSQASFSSPPTSGVDNQASLDDYSYTTSEKLAIVKSCATVYPATVSRLTSVQDSPLPPTEPLAALIATKPRIARVELLQDVQAERVAGLRARSAELLQRWYSLDVLAQGECWAEWEERLMGLERLVRRREAVLREEARESGL